MKSSIRSYSFILPIALLIILLDQWTKWLIRTHLAYSETWSPWEWLTPYVRIVHWQNTGAAFGVLQNSSSFFILLAIIVAGIILVYFPQVPETDTLLRIALSMQLGGAVGNLIDRLTQGWVTDFISVGSFPVFNIADSSISIGVVILLMGVWISERSSAKEREQENINLSAESYSEVPNEESQVE